MNRFQESMTTTGSIKVEGGSVSLGDFVGFKSDIEQYGTVIGFKKGLTGMPIIVIENKYGFSGDYIGGENVTEQCASDCWID